uniref:Uncharacterized protein n=1 Tax=Romanomermis culicivorax TaxID=13658 RepID=A0A915JFV5_ROMCU
MFQNYKMKEKDEQNPDLSVWSILLVFGLRFGPHPLIFLSPDQPGQILEPSQGRGARDPVAFATVVVVVGVSSRRPNQHHFVVVEAHLVQVAFEDDVAFFQRCFCVRQHGVRLTPEHIFLQRRQLIMHVVGQHVADLDVSIENVIQFEIVVV